MNHHTGHQSDAVLPTEMKRLLRALSDDKSVQIVAELLRNGKMRFGEIKDAFGLSSSSLSSKLKKLQNGGLVVNFYAKGSDLGHSYYDATEMSELVFDSLFNILYAPNAPRREYDAGHNIPKHIPLHRGGRCPGGITRHGGCHHPYWPQRCARYADLDGSFMETWCRRLRQPALGRTARGSGIVRRNGEEQARSV